MPNPKVPEAVLEAYRDGYEEATIAGLSSEESLKRGLAAALAQHHKELLGDEAAEQVCEQCSFPSHFDRRAKQRDVRQKLQAAIDSVMKGGEGG